MPKNFLGGALLLPLVMLCAVATLPSPARASTELDRRFSLETIGCLKSYDNVDGLFTDYVAAAYKDYFSRQSRFKLQDLSKADAVLSDAKTPYSKLIQDTNILNQLARATRSESLIRTTVQKEGRQYRFKMEWLLAPKMELIGEESFMLAESTTAGIVGLGDVQGSLQQALDKLIAKIPFVAQITGRDNNSVTVDIGLNAKVRKGDIFVIGTLDDVKLHPLLKSVVEWRVGPIGRIEIEEVDEKIAFGKVLEEENSKKIARYMKVTQIMQAPIMVVQTSEDPESKPKNEMPKLGWVGGSLGVGSLSRQYTTASSSLSGGGMVIFPKAEAQIWLTREWMIDTAFGYGFGSYSQSDAEGTATAAGSVSSSASSMRFAVGYSHLVNGSFYGPKGILKLGYQTISYTLPYSVAEATDSIGFSSILIGLGGELPIRNRYAALINLNFGLFAGGSETNKLSGTSDSASMANIYIGAQYHYEPKIMLRFGMDLTSNSATFGTKTLSQKVLTFGPSILYYF